MSIRPPTDDQHSSLTRLTEAKASHYASSGTDNIKLVVAGLSKHYRNVRALDGVDFEIRRGEVMGLVGENGAGKSTLIKLISGLITPDAGRIELDGRAVTFASRAAAEAERIAVVEQEISMVPTLSVAENVFLGNPERSVFRRKHAEVAASGRFLELVGLGDLDPRTLAANLTVAEAQLVEVARLLARDAQLLILDEPTAALAQREIETVKQVVRSLAAEGRSVIYVSHHLDEIFDLAQRVTVLRDGRSQPAMATSELTVDELVKRMLGRTVTNMFPPRHRLAGGPVVLETRDLVTSGLASPVSLEVHQGEVLGLAAQMGSGATALLHCLAGVQPRVSGHVLLNGEVRSIFNPRAAKHAKIAFCSGDRKVDGFFGIRTVRENLVVPAIRSVTPYGLRSMRAERDLAHRLASTFQLDTRRMASPVNALSGGNQQKVALGRWIGIEPRVLLIDEPTRGVDVGARAEIYRHLRGLAEDGLAIVFASSDVQEILGLADTVATFYHGQLVRVMDTSSAGPESVTRDITHPDIAGTVAS